MFDYEGMTPSHVNVEKVFDSWVALLPEVDVDTVHDTEDVLDQS